MSMTGEPVRTTCPYCGVGCGVLATSRADGSVTIKGDPEHPSNFGRLCSKGSALGETLSLDGRLLFPRVDGARATWDEALDLVAKRFGEAIAAHGPEAVAFYVSGQLLTEDYYVANKLMKGYIGAANIDSNSRLCMASTVAGQRRAFGTDTVPGCYEDLELADLVVLVGSNLAWCHPVLFQRLLAAREQRGTRIVVIDPRRTTTAEAADLHLAIRGDGDVALFAGLLAHLARDVPVPEWVETPPAGAQPTCSDEADVAARTGLVAAEVRQFFDLFAGTEKVVTVWSQGVNQSASGVAKVNAIINCHLVTGRIGRPGMGPFSVTGQPNAMGGREVGALANLLAAHMEIEDATARDRLRRFWASPAMAARPGLKAVDLFKAVSSGKIKALWIMGTNPAVSLPEADAVVSALEACPFVVVSDAVAGTDTARHADVLLPAATWGEKDGTVTNSERRISRQRAFLPRAGEARADWDIVSDVARRMGFSGFDYAGPADILGEYAALSGFENNGLRDFDISAHAHLAPEDYAALAPFQWPQPAGQAARSSRFFADRRFYRPGGKALMAATPLPEDSGQGGTGFRLNTGRIRDQWHTMTRTGKAARLMGQFGEPFCDINPADAGKLGIAPATLVELASGHGRMLCRARIVDQQPAGSVHVPMHWNGMFASQARVNALVPPVTDPISGQPALKSGVCTLKPAEMAWYGYAASVERPDAGAVDYWALAPLVRGFGLECAGFEADQDWSDLARRMFPSLAGADWIGVHGHGGMARLAAFHDGRLVAALFVDREPVETSRIHLADLIGTAFSGSDRLKVLAGRPATEQGDPGALVCACRRVGVNQIVAAINGGCTSVEAVGAACTAGTECGSCRSEIAQLIRQHAGPAPAQRVGAAE